MPVEVQIPRLGESVQEAVIARWLKADGSAVRVDEPLLELETDKANVEVAAEQAGVLRVLRPEGETVEVGDVVARIEEGGTPTAAKEEQPREAQRAPAEPSGPEERKAGAPEEEGARAQPAPVQEASAAPSREAAESARDTRQPAPSPADQGRAGEGEQAVPDLVMTPAARRLVAERGIDRAALHRFSHGGHIAKEDVLAFLEAPEERPAPPRAPEPARPLQPATESEPEVVRERMSRLRQRIAERLVEAQHTAAILTTFNEVDMSAVMDWRARHKERFQKAHGVSLGFVSFFAQACVGALGDVPLVNAQIEGDEVVRHRHVHLGIAVASNRGLVVPVIRSADRRSFPELEQEIARLAELAREGKLGPDDLVGGTFTISNGGVFGSLLSTPILNPPQSGILGMHKIEKRAVVVGDEIVVRPMMYLALSYDHRIIDGEQAVTFLVRVKERIEDPGRMLLRV